MGSNTNHTSFVAKPPVISGLVIVGPQGQIANLKNNTQAAKKKVVKAVKKDDKSKKVVKP